MNTFDDNIIKCIPVFQNQQDFLIGVFNIRTILKFTQYTRRLIVDYDENNLPIYNPQIQREVEKSRVQSIAYFLIHDANATFPTNIVLHIPSLVIESQEVRNGFVEIQLSKKVAEGVKIAKSNNELGDIYLTIIDGQHRIAGIEEAFDQIEHEIKSATQTLQKSPDNKDLSTMLNRLSQRKTDLLNMELVVSFFVDKTLEYQAMIFSTINRTQKRVSDSLVSSLFGLTTEDSPQKTALQTVLALNAHQKSPFFNRVNLYGNSYEKNQSPPLSQATMVKSIVSLISETAREAEEDRYKKRNALSKRSGASSKSLPFRTYYANDKDNSISDIFFYYFTAVSNVFKDSNGESYWYFNPESMKPTNVLQTAVGYFALLNILVDILDELKETDRYQTSSYEAFLAKAKSINVKDLKRYPLTSKSRTILYLDISLLIWPAIEVNDARVIRRNDLLNKD